MNPYKINERTVISFSGGRSSAYMLYKVLEANDGLPDEAIVCFANTGREMPETLDFVRDCGENWGVDIAWVELRSFAPADGPPSEAVAHRASERFGYATVVVDHLTASRDGEPFSSLVDSRSHLPNAIARYCTKELKIDRIQDYAATVGYEDAVQLVGIRGDESARAVKTHGIVNYGHLSWCPMWLDGVTAADVGDFWTRQNFDLNLPNNNGVTDWGNCDICFLKGVGKRQSIIRERPDLADWWIAQENRHNDRFRRDQPSYEAMQVIARSGGLDLFDDDPTIPCFCGD